MDDITPDEKLKIISSEICDIQNIQILLKDSFSLKELDSKVNVFPYLMLVELLENHICNITKLM